MRTYRIVDSWGQDVDGDSFEAGTHVQAHRALCQRLRVAGPRALLAMTPDGAEVYASLYDGEDYIRDAAGRRRSLN